MIWGKQVNRVPNIDEIWPQPTLELSNIASFRKIEIAAIENYFSAIYPISYPVLMPSGRSALRLILSHLGLGRTDLVSIPKFSSHCIINSVGLVATPTQEPNSYCKNSIIFHQWGFIRTVASVPGLIEDSADSLIPMGGNLFPNDGRFEIISLPKVFGTFIGGLILCQNKKDADELMKERDASSLLGSMHFYLRVLSQYLPTLYTYWNAAEPSNTLTPSIALKDIWSKIQRHNELIADRQKKIDFLIKNKIRSALKVSTSRLPCCWPIPAKHWPENSSPDQKLIRHIHGATESAQYEKVFPLPIHHQIPIETIKKWLPNKC